MGTQYIEFRPVDGTPPSSNYATLVVNDGTNFPVTALAFDAGTPESVFFEFRAVNYASGNLTIDIEWYSRDETSGNVVWEAQIACITPNTDDQDIEADGLATLNYVQDPHIGTVAKRLHRATITLSNLDNIAADDACVLKITRDADDTNATDNLTGDALLTKVVVSYTTA